MSVHIFTTTHDTWLTEGLRHALLQADPQAEIKISVVDSAGMLLTSVGNRIPEGGVLLPVFPDNHFVTSLRSLSFLNEWQTLQSGLFRFRAPCILWGHSPFIRTLPAVARVLVIPWRTSPATLAEQINVGIQQWRQRRCSTRYSASPYLRQRLSPREVAVLRHTLDGRSLDWIAQALGVSSKTVWTHRRRAMDVLGIRRLHELMQVPASTLFTLQARTTPSS
ncbi:helix-turn-helix transcriptional regulator [Salmonella enterica subsp. enterica serovar Glostrup]|nr:helix-turn-helix transcriptional regulator [Salmonella enterica subsp. enterica serovar Glostrup]